MRAQIYGITQSGKTYFALWKVSQYIKKNRRDRYVIYDSSDDMYEKYLKDLGFDKTELTRKSPKTVDFYSILKDEPKQFFHIHSLPSKKLTTYMNDLAGDLLDLGSSVFVVDEAYSVFSLGAESKMPNLASITRAGDKTGLDWILISQQPVDLAMTGRSQADTLYTFKLTTSRHIEKILDYMPDEVSESDVENLDKREFLVYNIYDMGVGKGNTEGLEISL